MMALVWRNYFDPPSSAPPPDESWLRGIRSKPMRETRKAVIEAEASRLEETELDPSTRVLVLFGKSDICGLTVERLFARYPEARHVVLEDAGHLPWVQSPETFRAELCTYFGC
jgi:pimeloyl-ACP methyl ester carboxylesterase